MRIHHFIINDERYHLAISSMDCLYCRRRFERTTEVECLGSIKKFDGKHTLSIEHHLI